MEKLWKEEQKDGFRLIRNEGESAWDCPMGAG